MRPIMTSSGTRFPSSINSLAFTPREVLFATAARRRSPVEMWALSNSFERSLAWVPLPEPGGPNRMMRIDYGSYIVSRRLVEVNKLLVDLDQTTWGVGLSLEELPG